ncbi:MAG: hypothetical protein ACYDCK_01890 [Thermoplasmatota archaeon]
MKFVLGLAVLSLLIALVPVIAASDDVGASGQCYKNGVGGQDEVEVGADGSVTAPTVTGTVAAVVQLATTGCDYGSTSYGYIEVHVLGTQLCESDKVVYTDGHCPYAPPGP